MLVCSNCNQEAEYIPIISKYPEEINWCKRCRTNAGVKRYYQTHKSEVKKRAKVWIQNNRERYKESADKSKQRLKSEYKTQIYDHYGNKCNCCNITVALQIDHINNDGKDHRTKVDRNSLYYWIVKNSFPDTLQLLCRNCNIGKSRNYGTCPHKGIIQRPEPSTEGITDPKQLRRLKLNKLQKDWDDKTRKAVFTHYNNQCNICKETNFRFFELDHLIDPNTLNAPRSGIELYHWIENNNFPSYFQLLCANCNYIKYYGS